MTQTTWCIGPNQTINQFMNWYFFILFWFSRIDRLAICHDACGAWRASRMIDCYGMLCSVLKKTKNKKKTLLTDELFFSFVSQATRVLCHRLNKLWSLHLSTLLSMANNSKSNAFWFKQIQTFGLYCMLMRIFAVS